MSRLRCLLTLLSNYMRQHEDTFNLPKEGDNFELRGGSITIVTLCVSKECDTVLFTAQKKHFPHTTKWVVPIQCRLKFDLTPEFKKYFILFFNGL
jgi:hypothetical protein